MRRIEIVAGVEIVPVPEDILTCDEPTGQRAPRHMCSRLARYEIRTGSYPRMCIQHARIFARLVSSMTSEPESPHASHSARRESAPAVQRRFTEDELARYSRALRS
jgi:hypothetical protein